MTRPKREFEVDADEAGARLEAFLRKRLGLARPLALKALRKGWVRVDGSRAKGSQRLETGQTVRITNYGLPLPGVDGPAPALPEAPAEWVAQARASVRARVDGLVVASKPAGRPVHAGSGHAAGWVDAVGAALGVALTPVGRLDRDTSGLLALAEGRGPARRLFAALRAGELKRTYQALVAGVPAPREGLIDLPLSKTGEPGQEQMRPDPAGKPARTRYRVLEAFGARAARLELHLETGRTHQIRAHLHARGHPILGDPRYTSPASLAETERLGVPRLFLHAGSLEVPGLDGPQEFEDPLPAELQAVLARLEKP